MREPQWHKSSYSDGAHNCVEVREGESVLVRDTQHRELGNIDFPAEAWTALLNSLSTQ